MIISTLILVPLLLLFPFGQDKKARLILGGCSVLLSGLFLALTTIYSVWMSIILLFAAVFSISYLYTKHYNFNHAAIAGEENSLLVYKTENHFSESRNDISSKEDDDLAYHQNETGSSDYQEEDFEYRNDKRDRSLESITLEELEELEELTLNDSQELDLEESEITEKTQKEDGYDLTGIEEGVTVFETDEKEKADPEEMTREEVMRLLFEENDNWIVEEEKVNHKVDKKRTEQSKPVGEIEKLEELSF
ncbi:hypothetical protein [Pseudalkalibacillus caeni]|uniref:Uncharacterized protein n=1 Tax=Exobacillus caeni TaxID=2574798 RepID=A0A5R9F9P7_9BACL|nr:hypothetical protein [Pseudalkalibacillus caeni]TLS39229.1 hypothetical protein FCL54_02675 [Pseudalkalibacillus caeni]